MTVKTDKVRITKIGGKVLKQVMLLIGLVSMIMFLSGNWGAWADTPGNLNDPETVIRMNVKANPEIDLKALETQMAADEEAIERETSQTEAGANPVEIDLTGEWEIQEEDKAYQAMLDAKGNGPYMWYLRVGTHKNIPPRLEGGTYKIKRLSPQPHAVVAP